MPTLTVVIPTRSRPEYWRTGRTLDSILHQSRSPSDLIVAADNDRPENLTAIIDAARWAPEHIHTRVLRITAPRPEPFPASAIPDNCLFHAAGPGPVLHLDDDCILRPTTCQLVGEVLDHHPTAAIWLPTHFVDEHLNRLDGPRFRDWRIDLAESWPPFLPDQRFKLIPG